MPKEVIYQLNDDFRVEICWTPNMAVSLGLRMTEPTQDDQPQNLVELAEWWAKDNDADTLTGLFTDLDRQSINRMIRVLRRARDQAYGRDE